MEHTAGLYAVQQPDAGQVYRAWNDTVFVAFTFLTQVDQCNAPCSALVSFHSGQDFMFDSVAVSLDDFSRIN